MDRIVIAVATELFEQGITANVINPGATDTGRISEEIEASIPRIESPAPGWPSIRCRHLGSLLYSSQGQWINGQLLHSDGGLTRDAGA